MLSWTYKLLVWPDTERQDPVAAAQGKRWFSRKHRDDPVFHEDEEAPWWCPLVEGDKILFCDSWSKFHFLCSKGWDKTSSVMWFLFTLALTVILCCFPGSVTIHFCSWDGQEVRVWDQRFRQPPQQINVSRKYSFHTCCEFMLLNLLIGAWYLH